MPHSRVVNFLCFFFCVSLGQAQSRPETPLASDFAPLKSVMVMAIGDNIFKSSELGSGAHPVFGSGLPRGTIREHQALLNLLRKEGVEVLDVADLLGQALEAAREAGTLNAWIQSTFPDTAGGILERIDEVDASSILGRRSRHFYVFDSDGKLNPLFPGITSMYWSRDFAVSTPRGIIIGHGKHYNRALENSIARLIFSHAERVKDFPIVFDAEKENVFLDGGDTTILDEKTIILGVGNRTSREAAPLLARKLNVDVLAVEMPAAEPANGLRRQLLHLDSMFNIVDRKTVLTVPFFLEKEWSDKNPLKKVLLGLKKQVETMNRTHKTKSMGNPEALQATVDMMPQVGWVTRYRAGSGEAEELKLKLVDYFRGLGYQVVYVGGEPETQRLEEYALEKAMYELRWQGANVVQLAPGRVIAYEHNIATNRALRKAGIEVLTFPGELLSIRNGGPHCLLMPLVRR